MVDKESSRELIAEYYSNNRDELTAFVIKRINHVADAEDIVQNVFLRLLTSEKMITEVTLPCLVYTVARNLITDRMRHFSIVCSYEHEVKSAGERTADDTETICSAREVAEMMEQCAAHILSEGCRRIYFMNLCEGKKTAEISKELSVKYKSVEHQLGVARREMRNYISLRMAR